MEIQFEKDGITFKSDLRLGTSIAIEMNFDAAQPNHFGAEPAIRQPVMAGDFVGSTREGGPCNVDVIRLTPHCNGTHTESVGHIVHDNISVAQCARAGLYLARLLTVEPQNSGGQDSYTPALAPDDKVITAYQLSEAIGESDLAGVDALVIRTLPNDSSKCSRRYGPNSVPAFLTAEAIQLIAAASIDHLLIDLPSIDRVHDDGLLSNHHLYWNVAQGGHDLNEESNVDKTITEMIYVPDSTSDGIYLLSLQIAPLMADAAPSRPVLYPLETASR